MKYAINLIAASALLACLSGSIQAQTTAPSAPSSVRAGEPVTLNFVNAEIEAVARTMATITGRNVVVDPRVKGQLHLVADQPITPAAAFQQFLAALRLQGFTVVEAAGLYKVVPEAEAKLQTAEVGITQSGSLPGVQGGQITTQIFKLQFENANNLLSVLRPLISPNNTINVNPGNNSLVITDYADNLQRMARIIAAMDVADATDVEIIALRYAIASDIVPLVARLIEGSAVSSNGSNGAAGTGNGNGAAATGTGSAYKTTVLAEPRSNAVVVRAANPARLAQVRALVERLDQPTALGNGDSGNIHVVYLKNADANKLAATLRAALSSSTPSPAASGTGTPAAATAAAAAPAVSTATGNLIQADPTTNSLIITAPDPLYRQLRAVIDKLDGRRAQILVESLIVEVSTKKLAEFGIQWQTTLGSKGDGLIGAIGNNSDTSGASILALTAGLAQGGTSAATAATTLGKGLNLALAPRIAGQYYLGALANFLQTNGDANVLSTPNLLTLDNEEAKIVIGDNVPFPTGSYANSSGSTTVNPFTTVERKDVGLMLRVRPQINANGTVKLSIYQETSQIDQSTRKDTNGPITSKRSIESNVLVDDGGIIVIGGLLQDNYSQSEDKVPVMGDLPVVGNLFRSESRQREKTNLMVFLRPTVLRDSMASNALTLDRYESIRALQQNAQPQERAMLAAVSSAPILPPAPARLQETALAQPVPPASEPQAGILAAPSASATAATSATVQASPTLPPSTAAPKPKASAAPTPAPAAASATYYVNIGTAVEATQAKKFRTQLERAKLPVSLHTLSTARGPRVLTRVGPYPSVKEAQAAAAQVRELALKAHVVRLRP